MHEVELDICAAGKGSYLIEEGGKQRLLLRGLGKQVARVRIPRLEPRLLVVENRGADARNRTLRNRLWCRSDVEGQSWGAREENMGW